MTEKNQVRRKEQVDESERERKTGFESILM